MVYFDLFYNFCLQHFSFCQELNEIWPKIFVGLHVKYPLFLSDTNESWMFSTDFWKTLKYQISWKSVRREPSCSIRTDMIKLIVAFRKFADAPKIRLFWKVTPYGVWCGVVVQTLPY